MTDEIQTATSEAAVSDTPTATTTTDSSDDFSAEMSATFDRVQAREATGTAPP